MRKFLAAIFAAMLLAGCGTQRVIGTDGKPLSKEESQRIEKKTVISRVENRDFRILVDEMKPLRGPSVMLRDNDWALEVRRDSIGSVLPYFGRGYNVPYGTHMGLHFITRIDSYTEEKVKDDKWRIEIRCHTSQEAYDFILEIFDNGTAYISVSTRYRDVVNYTGHIDVGELRLKRVK